MSEECLAELGRIEAAKIGFEDHGCLTFWLTFDFGGSGQSFGGFVLDEYSKAKDRRVGKDAGLDLISRLLTIFGNLDDFAKIKGRQAYALRREEYGPIVGVRLPKFDGGGEFTIDAWRAEWFPEKAK